MNFLKGHYIYIYPSVTITENIKNEIKSFGGIIKQDYNDQKITVAIFENRQSVEYFEVRVHFC